MHFPRIHFIIRVILVVIPVVGLFWLFTKDFVVSGMLVVEYDFSHDTPFIRQLRTPDKLDPIVYDRGHRDYTQTMRKQPVTFDVVLPRAFNRAVVEIRYQKDLSQTLRLGVQKQFGKWDPRYVPLVTRSIDGSWTVAEAQIDHLESFDFSKGKYQFVLNAQDLTPAKPGIIFTSIRIQFDRPPLTMDNLFPRVWNFLTRR